jgi:hypothetical protein
MTFYKKTFKTTSDHIEGLWSLHEGNFKAWRWLEQSELGSSLERIN